MTKKRLLTPYSFENSTEIYTLDGIFNIHFIL